MSKFKNMLIASTGEIKEKRASIIVGSAEREQRRMIDSIQSEIDILEMDIEKLTDLAPENTYDLRPGSKNFDPQKWVRELQDKKEDLRNLHIRLDIAKATYKEWFQDIQKFGTPDQINYEDQENKEEE